MNGPIPFTKEQLKAMRASYKAGATLIALSEEYGISITAVRARLAAGKVDIRSRGSRKREKDPRPAEEIRALRRTGLKVEEVCQELGITERTYYRRLQK